MKALLTHEICAREYDARECMRRKCCDDAYIRDTIPSLRDPCIGTWVLSARKDAALRGRETFLLSRGDTSPITRVPMRCRVVAARNVQTRRIGSGGVAETTFRSVSVRHSGGARVASVLDRLGRTSKDDQVEHCSG